MPYQGNGTYETPDYPIFPAVPNTVIEAGKFNAVIEDIKGALNKAFLRDGQARMSATILMSGNKIEGLAPGAFPGDAVEYAQWQNGFTNPTFTNPRANTPTEAQTTVDNKLLVNAEYLNTIASRKGNVSGQTWSGTHVFPADTSIGVVSGLELATLNGATSNIQDQLNAKGNKAGETWSGVHDYRGGTLYVPTLPTDTSDDRPASTAFVTSFSLEQSLPGQAGNAGKFISTDGTSPIWKQLAWGDILTGKPNTAGGYGITDAVLVTGNQSIGGAKLFTDSLQVQSKSIQIHGGTASSAPYGAAYRNTRSLQISTDVPNFGGAYDDHSGFITYAVMPGGWGTAQARIAISTGPGSYYTASPAVIIEQSGLTAADFTIPSDMRLKKDIRKLQGSLGKLRKLEAFLYVSKDDEQGLDKLGLSAQGVQAEYPQAVSTFVKIEKDRETEYLKLSYQSLIPVLVAGISELADAVDVLAKKVG